MKRHRIEVIDRTYAAILAAKTPANRAAMIADCYKSALLILSAGERLRHPDWSPVQIRTAVAKRMSHGTI